MDEADAGFAGVVRDLDGQLAPPNTGLSLRSNENSTFRVGRNVRKSPLASPSSPLMPICVITTRPPARESTLASSASQLAGLLLSGETRPHTPCADRDVDLLTNGAHRTSITAYLPVLFLAPREGELSVAPHGEVSSDRRKDWGTQHEQRVTHPDR